MIFEPHAFLEWAKIEGGEVVAIEQRLRIAPEDFGSADWRPVVSNQRAIEDAGGIASNDFALQIEDAGVLKIHAPLPISPAAAARLKRLKGIAQ